MQLVIGISTASFSLSLGSNSVIEVGIDASALHQQPLISAAKAAGIWTISGAAKQHWNDLPLYTKQQHACCAYTAGKAVRGHVHRRGRLGNMPNKEESSLYMD